MTIERPSIFFKSVSELDSWLAQNFDQSGIWAIYFKKTLGKSDLNWESLVVSCLRFGWIDSVPGKVDEERTKTYISPRKPTSGWSRKNQNTVLELEAAGLMHPNGQAVLDLARANGSWTLFDKAEDLVIPAPLEARFIANPELVDGWERVTKAKRRQELQRYYLARTPATLEKRLEDLIRLASALNPSS